MRLRKTFVTLIVLTTLLLLFSPTALAAKPLAITSPGEGETISGRDWRSHWPSSNFGGTIIPVSSSIRFGPYVNLYRVVF